MSYKHLFGLIFLVLFLSQAVSAAGPAAVNLGSAGSFVILSKAGISTTGTTSIVGDIGVSPAAATYITGFGLILDSSTQFATSSLVTGKVYAADYSPPTPAKMTTAVSDMQTAYVDAAGRTNPTATELGAGNIGGMTLAPGLYKWGTGVTIPTSVTLSGGPNDVWIFQIAQNLNVGNGVSIILSGGAQPQNIFWQVAGQATLGTTSHFEGIILSQTAIVVNTGAALNGRALAQTAVTLNADAVTAPTGSGSATTTAATTSVATTMSTTAATTTANAVTTTAATTIATTIGVSTTVQATTTIQPAPTTTIGSGVTTTIGSGAASTIVLPTKTGVGNGSSFAWQGSEYYEIPLGGPSIPATGMKPGVAYLVTNPAFITAVNSWLMSE